MTFLDTIFLDNPLRQWALVLGIAVGAFLVLRVTLALVRGTLTRLADRTSTIWDDILVHALSRTRFGLVFLIAFALALRILELPEGLERGLGGAAVLILLLQAGLWASSMLGFWFDSYRETRMQSDPGAVTGFTAIAFLGNVLIWSTVLLLALDNFGVDITALVAGLGVGGIAVALALQNVLGDLFASLSIILDKPFVLGDFIVVGTEIGSVEKIGLKTTRIRSLSGEQLVFSNNDLLQSRIRNFGRMQERRVLFNIGVVYQTTAEKLEMIPGIIREAVERREKTRFDRSHFKEYGDFALVFETVYYVGDRDYNVYMGIQQAINLEIYRRFAEEGIGFAYPTQTLYLNRAGKSDAEG